MTLTRREAEESKEMEEGLRVHANALLSLPSSSTTTGSSRKAATAAEGVFECKTCSKRFPSFQALGGHRTSHTRLQAKNILNDDPAPAAEERGRVARVHECTVCGLEFSMGQALGGHMRRHRGEAPPLAVTDGAAARPDQEAMPDLNFPPLEDDDGFHGQERSGGDQNSSEPQLLNLLV